MKTMTSMLVLALFSANAVAPAQEERSSDREQANALFAKGDALINAGKIDAYFQQLYAPGFYAVDTNGKRTWLPDYKAQIKFAMGGWRGTKLKSTIKNVQLTDTELMVWVEEKLSYKAMQNGRWVPMNKTARHAYNLVRTTQGWAIMSSQELLKDEPWSFKTTH